MKRVQPHTVGSKLYQVEAVTQSAIVQVDGIQVCAAQRYAPLWRVLFSFRENGVLEYRVAHFLQMPKVGVLPHAGPQDGRRDIRVGDELVMEGAIIRLTFSEHGNSENVFYPLEFERGQLVDPFGRKEQA